MNYDGYFLLEYHLFKVRLIRENKKTFTVYMLPEPFWKAETRRVPKDKYVSKDTPFCVVWEQWKGVNGRGGYRLDTTKYPDKLAIGGKELVLEDKQ